MAFQEVIHLGRDITLENYKEVSASLEHLSHIQRVRDFFHEMEGINLMIEASTKASF